MSAARKSLVVRIAGVAFWSARMPDWSTAAAVMRGERDLPEAGASRPTPSLLAPTERRRAPDTVAVALEVAARACEAAGCDPQQALSVFASTHGDVAISDYMCSTLVSTPTLISPIKFHNSVHNAAAGYWSIGTGSYASYTAISAYQHTFGAGLLEAAVQTIAEQRPVLYVAFDIEAKGPLASMARSKGVLGVALVLMPDDGTGTRLVLNLQPVTRAQPTPAATPAALSLADNALAPALPFFEALATATQRELTLTLNDALHLQVHLQPMNVADH